MSNPTESPSELKLVDAVNRAFAFLTPLQKQMRAEIYGLEETAHDDKGNWLITISLTREKAPPRTIPGSSPFLFGRDADVPNPDWTYRVIRVHPATGQVLDMRDPSKK